VLARLLFGRGIDEITPLQAAQLASAVATLAGRGTGFTERLRQNIGLDDLDLTTTDDGGTALRAGKYLSENIYTDLTVDSEGETELNLNFDITPSFTVRGGVQNDGDTSLGIFFERDY
jgi:translocation and assembly module TamB